MNVALRASVARAKDEAVHVLLHNAGGPFAGFPRTAGWGYPEPYTRDLMIASLGILTSGNETLVKTLGRVLRSLARNQSELGHIPSLAHDGSDRGASDTTPLFLIALALYRKASGDSDFLRLAAEKALTWMRYQSPEDLGMVAQLPTTDWRDEQWVLGYGLYVNMLVYTHLRLHGRHESAERLRTTLHELDLPWAGKNARVHGGLSVPNQPGYAFWSFKMYSNRRFDLLGNCLAMLSGFASPARAKAIVKWIEQECAKLRASGLLSLDLPPCFFPYVQPGDADWYPRYAEFNRPGEYHNGGVWPFVCGFYVAALVAAGRFKLAEAKLAALTDLVIPARRDGLAYGFNEWFRAVDGTPAGQDWQTWSAAMYIYAAVCVEQRQTPFFEDMRRRAVR